MRWTVSDNNDNTGISSDLSDILGDVSSLLDSLSSVISSFRNAIEVLSVLLGVGTDIFSALVEALIVVLNNFRSLYSSNSISYLYHFPGMDNEKAFKSPNEILYDVGMSYIDQSDKNRPIADVPVYGASIVFLWSFLNPEQLSSQLNSIKSVFNSVEPSIKSELNSSQNLPTEVFLRGGADGMAPDWGPSLSLLQINSIKNFDNQLSSFIGSLRKNQLTKAQRIVRVIDLLEAKLSRITDLSQRVTSSLQGILNMINVGDGSDILVVKGTGTSSDFANAIINSTNLKEYPSESLNENTNNTASLDELSSRLYSGAFVLHVQASTLGTTVEDDEIKNQYIDTVVNFFINGANNDQIVKGEG